MSRRDRIVGVLFVVLPALDLGLYLLLVVSQHLPVAWVRIVVGLAACPLLWWRRRWPVGVLLVLLALLPFGEVGVSVSLALFSLAIRSRVRVSVSLAALTLVTTAGVALAQQGWPPPTGTIVEELVAVAVFHVLVLGAGLGVRAVRQRRQRRAARAEADVARRAEEARDAERRRIAREMHDVLAHRISLVCLHAGALEVRAADLPDEVAAAASVIRSTAYQALQEMRTVIGALRTDSAERAEPGPRVEGAGPRP